MHDMEKQHPLVGKILTLILQTSNQVWIGQVYIFHKTSFIKQEPQDIGRSN